MKKFDMKRAREVCACGEMRQYHHGQPGKHLFPEKDACGTFRTPKDDLRIQRIRDRRRKTEQAWAEINRSRMYV